MYNVLDESGRNEMSTITKPLTELVEELSPSSQRVVRDFVEFLLAKEPQKRQKSCVRIGPVSCATIAISILP